MDLMYNDYISLFKFGIFKTKYKKMNGEIKEYLITLKKEFLPEEYKNYDFKIINENISVWDINQNKWKTFKIKNIQSLEMENN